MISATHRRFEEDQLLIIDHGIQESLAELIENLANAPSEVALPLSNALFDYLLELLDEQILEAREYSVLSQTLQTAFWKVACQTPLPFSKTNGHVLKATDAIELVAKINAASTAEEEIESECDIGIFIDRIHREVKLGLVEEVELDFYRRWMSRTLYSRSPIKQETR